MNDPERLIIPCFHHIETPVLLSKVNAATHVTPFLTAPAGVQYFTGVRPGVTGVQLRSPGRTGVTMKPVGVHPSQPEMQNLAGGEISALKSYWGALQAYEKGWARVGMNYQYSFGVWDQSRWGVQGCKSSYKSRNSYFFKIPPKISYFFLLESSPKCLPRTA